MNCETLLVFLAIFIAGCATVAPVSTPPYFPSNPSTVLLQHQGEIEASGSVSTGGETFLAAYALTSHLGVRASGSMALHKASDPNGNQYSGELGAGYFDTMTPTHIYSELYGGIGWGSGNSTVQTWEGSLIPELDWQITGNEQTRFAIAWIEGATGYARGNFSAVILLRISDVNIYHDVKQESVIGDGLDNYKSDPYDTTVSATGNVWTIIPGFEIRYGFARIQLIAAVFMPLLESYDPFLEMEKSNTPRPFASLGLCYKF